MLPTSRSTIDSTLAKIGRSTKKCANLIEMCPCQSAAVALAGRRERGRLRVDYRAGAHAHETVNDDRLLARETVADPRVAIDARPGTDRLHGDRVARPYDEDHPPVLVAADRLVRDQHPLVGARTHDADA